jgi:hypothetical protein
VLFAAQPGIKDGFWQSWQYDRELNGFSHNCNPL